MEKEATASEVAGRGVAPDTYLDSMEPAHIQVTVGDHQDPDRGLRQGFQKPQQQRLCEH